MNMTAYGFTITSFDLLLLSACGTLVIILIQLRFRAEMRKRDIFNKSAKEFTDTFCRELREVYSPPVKWPDNINRFLAARIDKLKMAVGNFRLYLPWWKRYFFDKAWFRFYCCTGREVDKNCQVYHDYMPFKGVSMVNGNRIEYDNTKTYKDKLRKNIFAVLKFAKQK